jgi:NADP-dependent 3-hydroxy acid dehydrogenase YdfG
LLSSQCFYVPPNILSVSHSENTLTLSRKTKNLFFLPAQDSMERTSDCMLLLIGSGPGVGVAVASHFAQKHFDRIALFARNPQQLQKDREAVLAAAARVNRVVVVQTWQVDIGDQRRLEQALAGVEQFGRLECVYFNAARVGHSQLFQFPLKSIEEDFRVTETTFSTKRAILVYTEW